LNPFARYALSASVAALVLSVTPAWADDTDYSLNAGNAGLVGGGSPPPYGTVNVLLTSGTTAHITFTALTNGTLPYAFFDGSSVAVNTNGDATISNVVGNTPSWSIGPGPYTPVEDQNVSTFGSFSDAVNSFDGRIHSATVISFDLTLTGGTWASSDDVLEANAGGFFVAAHIGPCVDTACSAFGATGFASGDGFPGSSTVLEPNSASLALLALGLLGGGFWTRRKA